MRRLFERRKAMSELTDQELVTLKELAAKQSPEKVDKSTQTDRNKKARRKNVSSK